MNALAREWEYLSIEEIIAPIKSIDPLKNPNETFKYIDIGSIDNENNVIVNPKKFLGIDAPSRARRLVQVGDVLFSTVRTYLKNIAIVTEEYNAALTSTGIAVLRPTQRINGRYLFYYVSSASFIDSISKAQDGTMYPAVSDRDVTSMKIALPPPAEQSAIVEKIDCVRRKTTRASQELSKIPQLVRLYSKTILDKAFCGELTAEWRSRKLGGDSSVVPRATEKIRKKYRIEDPFKAPYELPRDWRWLRLPEIGDIDRGKSKHRPRNDVSLYGGRYPFVQTGEIREAGQYLSHFTKTYNEKGLAQSRLWKAGTVCITIAANIAETTILGIDACFPDSVVGFSADQDRAMSEYIEFFLRTAKADLAAFAPATAQKNINLDTLASIRVPMAPFDEQREIVRLLTQAFSWLDRQQSEQQMALRLLPKLNEAILAKAFRGELVHCQNA